MIEPVKKKTKQKMNWDITKPAIYILFGLLVFIASAALGSMAVDPKGEAKILEIKAGHFCSVVDKSAKIEMTDRTVDHLTYQVTCE